MKKTLKFLIAASTILFAGCDPSENMEMEKQMVGEWQSVDLKINMTTYKNKEGSKVFEVKENEWESKMNIKPILTLYKADGTYIAEHHNLMDSIIFKPAGKWKIFGTILQLQDTFPETGPAYTYTLTLKDNIAELRGLEDCDRDENADDEYFGRLRKK